MFNQPLKQQGSIKWVIMIIIALILGSYFFDFSVQDAIEDEQTQENLEYVKDESTGFYNEHLKEKVDYVWNEIFIGLLWDSFTNNMTRIKNGEPAIIETGAPSGDDTAAPTIEISDSSRM